MRRRWGTVAVAAVMAVTPAACGGDESDGDATSSDEPKAAAPQGDDFCDEFTANGGNGSMVGPIAVWESKESLTQTLDANLSVMGDLTPPDEIAEYWADAKSYYTQLRELADELPAGGTLSDLDVIKRGNDIFDDSSVFTEYFFDHCV